MRLTASRRSFFSMSAAALLLALSAACGASGQPTAPGNGATPAGAAAGRPSPPNILPRSVPAGGVLPDDLQPLVTYDDGTARFTLPPSNYTPVVSADTAYKTYVDSGLYPDAVARSSSFSTRLALYTEIVGSELRYKDLPVWVVAFVGYPETLSGGAMPSGHVTTTVSDAILQDILVVVSAETGKGVVTKYSVPDRPPVPTPRVSNPPAK